MDTAREEVKQSEMGDRQNVTLAEAEPQFDPTWTSGV